MRFPPLIPMAAVLFGIAVAIVGVGLANAVADPVVRRTGIALPDWPAGAAPVTIALVSDLHVGNMTMRAGRLERMVAQVNALRPDLVLMAGDFIGGHHRVDAALGEPILARGLARLRAPLGVVAVLGNHDHWTDAVRVRRALRRAGVTVLENGAAVRGPVVIGGLDDRVTGHDRLRRTIAAMRAMPGGRVLLAHSPDTPPDLPDDITMLMAGHTHCGQVVLPVYGAVVSVSDHGDRYRCGIVPEKGRRTIVTAGLGTSGPPLRYGAPPDIWLIRLGPASVSRSRF
ncbi:phosphohydrolase [Sphingomonas sp. Leaf17]|uniref:metallophosphoesterase n=1 Tax=Sphingomonas sp. Leaf17 TaxID=1735683 RepID=UPI0006FFC7E0|nr:metallophosphoesterase [Sphingomonas sp. Leaf17]KQM64280.1 phosphohydrolase [Sphingomonas sp. Leaf17]